MDRVGVIFLYGLIILSMSCSSESEYKDFSDIHATYASQYLIKGGLSSNRFSATYSYLVDSYSIEENKDSVEILCKVGVDGGLIKNSDVMWYVQLVLIKDTAQNKSECWDVMQWYAIKVGLVPDENSPFVFSVAEDNLDYFLMYKDYFGYDEIFKNFPDIHVYAASNKSCGIMNYLRADDSNVTLNKVMNEVRFKRYASLQCGD